MNRFIIVEFNIRHFTLETKKLNKLFFIFSKKFKIF